MLKMIISFETDYKLSTDFKKVHATKSNQAS